ncbi:MAG: YjhX family toxin [Shinella sp.]|uniref:YjhX family toxin n=1 Tax=Shinella sp. TaxID=1870904 RepID=UPI003C723092
MDISRAEQRILHLLAQGGRIDIEKDETRKLVSVACITRDGWRTSGLDIDLFRKLKRRRCIASIGGKPYRITQRGLELVRSQQDNQ